MVTGKFSARKATKPTITKRATAPSKFKNPTTKKHQVILKANQAKDSKQEYLDLGYAESTLSDGTTVLTAPQKDYTYYHERGGPIQRRQYTPHKIHLFKGKVVKEEYYQPEITSSSGYWTYRAPAKIKEKKYDYNKGEVTITNTPYRAQTSAHIQSMQRKGSTDLKALQQYYKALDKWNRQRELVERRYHVEGLTLMRKMNQRTPRSNAEIARMLRESPTYQGGISGQLRGVTPMTKMEGIRYDSRIPSWNTTIPNYSNDTGRKVSPWKTTAKEIARGFADIPYSLVKGYGKTQQIMGKTPTGRFSPIAYYQYPTKYFRGYIPQYNKYEKGLITDKDVEMLGATAALGAVGGAYPTFAKWGTKGLTGYYIYDLITNYNHHKLGQAAFMATPMGAELMLSKARVNQGYSKALKELTELYGANSKQVKEFKTLWKRAFEELPRKVPVTKEWTSKDVASAKNKKVVNTVNKILKDNKAEIIGSTVITPQTSLRKLPRGKAGDVDVQNIPGILRSNSKKTANEIYSTLKKQGFNVKIRQKDFFGTPKYHVTLDGKELVNVGSSSKYFLETQAGPLKNWYEFNKIGAWTKSQGVKMGNIRDQMRVKLWKGFVEKNRVKDIIDARGIKRGTDYLFKGTKKKSAKKIKEKKTEYDKLFDKKTPRDKYYSLEEYTPYKGRYTKYGKYNKYTTPSAYPKGAYTSYNKIPPGTQTTTKYAPYTTKKTPYTPPTKPGYAPYTPYTPYTPQTTKKTRYLALNKPKRKDTKKSTKLRKTEDEPKIAYLPISYNAQGKEATGKPLATYQKALIAGMKITEHYKDLTRFRIVPVRVNKGQISQLPTGIKVRTAFKKRGDIYVEKRYNWFKPKTDSRILRMLLNPNAPLTGSA